MRNLFMFFIAFGLCVQMGFSQKQCCTGIYLDVRINDCDVSICAYPTDILEFCENFPYSFTVDVFDEDGVNIQTFDIDDPCFFGFQGIPGAEYTVQFTTNNPKRCERTPSNEVTFTFPEDCVNCCESYSIEAQVEDCTIQYCLVPDGDLCAEPVDHRTSVQDPFGNGVPVTQISTFCYEVTDLQGGLDYTISASLDYDLACDVADDVNPTTVSIPDECTDCEIECLDLISEDLTPDETSCLDRRFNSYIQNTCTGEIIDESGGYQFSWVGNDGFQSNDAAIEHTAHYTYSVTVMDADGCIFTDFVVWPCAEPGEQQEDGGEIKGRSTIALQLSPSPVSDVLYISGLNDNQPVKLVIRSMNGQIMGSWNTTNDGLVAINVENFPAGQYILTHIDENANVSSKSFVKQ